MTDTESEAHQWAAILTRLAALRAGLHNKSAADLLLSDRSTEPRTQIDAIYGPLVTTNALVIAQLGQTLDGHIATWNGDSHFVTGPDDIRHLHRLRALVDAVVVGAGTVIADDPQLTVRHVRGDNPVRVVLDPTGRVPDDRQLFHDGMAPTLWLQSQSADRMPDRAGAETILLEVGTEGAGFDPSEILAILAARGLRRVLVEGGGLTVSSFLAAGVLDRLHLTVAPMLLGSGRRSVTLEPVDSLREALRPRCRHFALGEDILFDLCFRS